VQHPGAHGGRQVRPFSLVSCSAALIAVVGHCLKTVC
jgi:hypothetical protein